MKLLNVPDDLPPAGSADLILGLGAALHRDGSASLPTAAVAQRVIELYRARCAPVVVLSGGYRQNQVSEAAAMSQLLAEQSVVFWVRLDEAPDHVRGTHRQPASARDLFQRVLPSPPHRVILVAHPRHLPRALWLFRRAFPDIAWFPANATEVYDPAASQWRLRRRWSFVLWNLAAWPVHWLLHRRRLPEARREAKRPTPASARAD